MDIYGVAGKKEPYLPSVVTESTPVLSSLNGKATFIGLETMLLRRGVVMQRTGTNSLAKKEACESDDEEPLF